MILAQETYIKEDKKLMFELQVSDLDRFVARTEKGDLRLCYRYGSKAYYFTLDNLPLPDPTNKRLMESVGFNILKAVYPDAKDTLI